MKSKTMPTMPVMCKTCPFREEGWQELQPLLIMRATSTATPICHSTGKALTRRIFTKSHFCRGARNFQIAFFHSIGFLSEPTEEAWNAKRRELGC